MGAAHYWMVAAASVAVAVVGACAVRFLLRVGSATIFVWLARLAVLAAGVVILLNVAGVSVTPMLTALGVGGMAAGLALRDTLANLFAGVYVLISREVEPGDFIRLDSGAEGYVIDTSWRNTTLLELSDNLVIVPNATLAASVVTSYHRPRREMTFGVPVGVALGSDLELVERVSCQAAREVMRTVDGGVPGFVPYLRFSGLSSSAITFSVTLQALEYAQHDLLVHEFIKHLHRHYQAAGIEIPASAPQLAVPVPVNHPHPCGVDASLRPSIGADGPSAPWAWRQRDMDATASLLHLPFMRDISDLPGAMSFRRPAHLYEQGGGNDGDGPAGTESAT